MEQEVFHRGWMERGKIDLRQGGLTETSVEGKHKRVQHSSLAINGGPKEEGLLSWSHAEVCKGGEHRVLGKEVGTKYCPSVGEGVAEALELGYGRTTKLIQRFSEIQRDTSHFQPQQNQ